MRCVGKVLVVGGVLLCTGVSAVFGADRDKNGLSDAWEKKYFGRTGQKAGADPDGDELSNKRESQIGTHPRSRDTDGDGLSDGQEINMGLSPLGGDTDGDGLGDGYEVNAGLNPHSGDTDGDGLGDAYEVNTGLNPRTGDSDGDGLADAQELQYGTAPLNADTDGDGMLDGYEIGNGLDPKNGADRWEDLDGDRIPNIFEASNGSRANDKANQPAPHLVVDPTIEVETATTKKTLAAAIEAVPNLFTPEGQRYAIISVKPGTYREMINIYNKRILLLGEFGGMPPKIQPPDPGFTIHATRCVFFLDGFEIDGERTSLNKKSHTGILVVRNLSQGQFVRIANCDIHSFETQHTNHLISLDYGTLRVLHCTFRNNKTTVRGSILSVGPNCQLGVDNSILWNPEIATELTTSDDTSKVSVQGSVMRGGKYNSLDQDPLLDRYGFLNAGSPAIDAGILLGTPSNDLSNHPRTPSIDSGAYQFRDIDHDGLPDAWEVRFLGNILSNPTDDDDGDALTNQYEYFLGFAPNNPTTLGNGKKDFDEAQKMPRDSWTPKDWNIDSDEDGMPDAYETKYGFQPANPNDALDDADKDRIPNIFEFAHSTNPFDPTSTPHPHIIVDPSVENETDTQKKSIASATKAISNAALQSPSRYGRYPILYVKSGIYSHPIRISGSPTLILGELGKNPPRIETLPQGSINSPHIAITNGNVILDGFEITAGQKQKIDTIWTIIEIKTKSEGDRVHLINCDIHDNQTSSALVYVAQGNLTLTHCTLRSNTLNQRFSNPVLLIIATGHITLNNSIVWNPSFGINNQLDAPTDNLSSSASIIWGYPNVPLNGDPKIDSSGFPMPEGLTIGGGNPALSVAFDLVGNPRNKRVDIGAYQYSDIDEDGLLDQWERRWFGDLSAQLGEDPDGDGLTNEGEAFYELSPLDPDTYKTGRGDLIEALFSDVSSPSLPWFQDTDLDGLPDGLERSYGTDPLQMDTNKDGIFDGISFISGVDPRNVDLDGDGLSQVEEEVLRTDPFSSDSDGDGVVDREDAFPLDPTKQQMSHVGNGRAPKVRVLQPAAAKQI